VPTTGGDRAPDHGGPGIVVIVFAVICVLSAMALIYTKHESRKLFVELEGLTHDRDELNIEWGQLQIEQSTWATHARIEQVATDDLSLVRPRPTDIFVIERQ
jgi:cell division protein FtsL